MFDVADIQLFCSNLDNPMLRCLLFQVLCAWKACLSQMFCCTNYQTASYLKESTVPLTFTAECAMCATTHRECSRCQLNMTFRTVVAFQLQCRMGYPLQRSDVSIATINNNGGK